MYPTCTNLSENDRDMSFALYVVLQTPQDNKRRSRSNFLYCLRCVFNYVCNVSDQGQPVVPLGMTSRSSASIEKVIETIGIEMNCLLQSRTKYWCKRLIERLLFIDEI